MKLVREHINEFERGDNSLKNLGIGKKDLIENWLKQYDIKNYTINDDFTIDCEKVKIHDTDLEFFPEYIQFNVCHGWFSISENKLITLRGCPYIVYGNFGCSVNQLNSLEFCPKRVQKWVNSINIHYQGDFFCTENPGNFSKKDVLKYCNVEGDIFI